MIFVGRGSVRARVNFDEAELGRVLDLLQHVEARDPGRPLAPALTRTYRQSRVLAAIVNCLQ